MKKVYYKKDIMLKEDQERNYAASTDGADKTASQAVTDTLNKNPDATKVTVPADEINGSQDSTTTVQVPANTDGYTTAQNMARKLGSDASKTNFEFTIKEGITFTKGELSDFLRSI